MSDATDVIAGHVSREYNRQESRVTPTDMLIRAPRGAMCIISV